MCAERSPAPVWMTANFEANLGALEAYWAEREAQGAYADLLDELVETVVPNLERHPGLGRPFLARAAGSAEGLEAARRLAEQTRPR